MRRSIVLLALAFGASTAIVFGCTESEPDDGDPLPGSSGQIGPDGATITPVENECRAVSPIHASAACDTCVRAECCTVVLDCERSEPCKALRACLAPCQRGDFDCSNDCRTRHDLGTSPLAAVDKCASLQCPDACGSAFITPDGG